ncbi:MAG TPA: hybrid sensor histidine kinase/response regulator [Burkholderiales bacterium]|nr:hybrid sensor histidine kinase/response regulator [Burkholderiales bacterium]
MHSLFSSDLWQPALDKYTEVTGLTVELFGLERQVTLSTVHPTPLVQLFLKYGFEPGLFAECARRCLSQTSLRPAVVAAESHGLAVVGASLVLEGAIVGAAVAGYAFAGFSQVAAVQRWAKSAGVPFESLWTIARRQVPVPERRLMLYGELLQVLGDALLRENYRTRQYEDAVVKLQAASAAKDEFMAVLSHELRTPLAPIAGWASVLKHTDNLEQVHRAAEAIERNAFLQSRMIDDLLDMNRISHGTIRLDLEILNLQALIRPAVETSAHAIDKKSVRLEIVGAAEPLLVDGDAGRLQQVFRNVISNAVKFTPAGGSIRVTLSREAYNALIVVTDTGVGIAPEFLPFVFDIFRQQEQGTRREHEGLGIGLSLVKKLTELHKGTVSVASAGTGRGTVVSIRLPLAAQIPDLDAAALPVKEPSASTLAGHSILVVEDSEDTRESLRILLENLGAQVSVARDGREALDMIQDADPDLVLCDLRMPNMDGYEFMRELQRGASPVHPPVLAMSGFASEADYTRTREAGFTAHIRKPYDAAGIVAAVGAALTDKTSLPNRKVKGRNLR